MAIYEADLEEDENGEFKAICPECEGTGKADEEELDEWDRLRKPDCEVCCGFGRLDW
jgi:hypothetical protein